MEFIMIFVFLFAGLFLLNIFTSIWAYRDSLNMGNSKEYSLIVLFGTIAFPVLGLLVYFIIRRN